MFVLVYGYSRRKRKSVTVSTIVSLSRMICIRIARPKLTYYANAAAWVTCAIRIDLYVCCVTDIDEGNTLYIGFECNCLAHV